MISAQWLFYFSASVLLGFNFAVVYRRRNRINGIIESRLKAFEPMLGETFLFPVSLRVWQLEIHS